MEHINCCTTCKKTKVEAALMKHYKYIRKDGTEVQKYLCRECNRNKSRSWYKNNKARAKEIIKKSEMRYPEKQQARILLNYAVKTMLVNKPEQCQDCKRKEPLQGHHNDYNKPLIVEWLCTNCHSNRHKG